MIFMMLNSFAFHPLVYFKLLLWKNYINNFFYLAEIFLISTVFMNKTSCHIKMDEWVDIYIYIHIYNEMSVFEK